MRMSSRLCYFLKGTSKTDSDVIMNNHLYVNGFYHQESTVKQ